MVRVVCQSSSAVYICEITSALFGLVADPEQGPSKRGRSTFSARRAKFVFSGLKQMREVYELTIAHFVIFPNSVNLLITL